jgi:hypothetical protein
MGRCLYRLSNTTDPEERLEDAVLAKALHDVLGPELTLLGPDDTFPEGGLHLGRSRRNERTRSPLSPDHIRYWEDPAFLRFTSRDWGHFDLEGAEADVARLHEGGRDAVVKSTLSAKHMITGVPRGTSLADALDAMVYSFCDRPPCLLVQERVEMRCERRFLFLDGELLTQSAVGSHLTPMSRVWEPGPGQLFEDLHLATPASQEMLHAPELTQRMTERAHQIAAASDHKTFCVDLCLIGDDLENGDIEPIEWNPFQPGQLGLFGCDPRAIATGVRAHLEMYPDSYRVGHVDRESLAQDLDGAPLENPQTSDMDWMEFDG